MGTKGTKASNIYQVLKGSGAWQSKDSQGPMIKGVGIKSPLNMKASPAKNTIDEKGRAHPLTEEQHNADAQKNSFSFKPGVNEPKKKSKKTSYSEAYKKRDMKTYGKLSEAEYTAEAKRQNESYKKTGKWDAPKKPMETKGESDKVVTTNNNKNTGESEKVTTGEDKKVTKTDTAKKNLETAKESVKDARSEVKDTNKAKRIQKRADKKAKKAKRIKDEGGTRVGNALRGIFKKKDKKEKSPAEMKSSPAKKHGHKSPAKKALVGKQNNLPEHIKQKIKAAPGKMKKYK